MKKYLIIGDGESPHILKWTRELNKHFEVYLISSRGVLQEIRDFVPGERIYSFNLNISESGGNLKFIRMLFPVRRIIKKIRPDYVNANYITSHGFLAALARKFSIKKFPLIISAWGTDIMVTPFKNRFYRALTSFSLKQASLVTTDSKTAAKLVRQFCNTPVNTFPFGLEKLPDTSIEEKDPHLFFSNRTLNANSNIDRVLEFFSRFYQNDSRARLVIANDGPKRLELEALSNKLGLKEVVSFTGFIPSAEQDNFYRKASYFFSVLTSDALSVSLLEALAYGCITIVSDLPDNREWVTDQHNGIILTDTSEPSDIFKLKEKDADIFDHNRKLISERAIFPDAIEQFALALIN